MHTYIRIPCTNYLTHAGSGSMHIQSTSKTRLTQSSFNVHSLKTGLRSSSVDSPLLSNVKYVTVK